MNNNELLKRLLNIQTGSENINSLILDIKKDLIIEAQPASQKTRFKKCVHICEQETKGSRPQLALTCFKEGAQYFIGGQASYLVKLTGGDILEDLPRTDRDYNFKNFEYKADTFIYPETKALFNNFYAGDDFKINASNLSGIAAAEKKNNIKLYLNSNIYLYLNAEKLNNLLLFLNAADTLILRYTGDMKPLKILKEDNESCGIICPLRHFEGDTIKATTYILRGDKFEIEGGINE